MDTIDAKPNSTIHHFQFPCGLVPPSVLKEMVALADPVPLLPTGLIIEIRTKDKGCLLHHIVESVLNSLKFSKLVDVPSIREMAVMRHSSIEETVDLHIVVLKD